MKKHVLVLMAVALSSTAGMSQIKYGSSSGKIKAKVAKKEAKEAQNDTAFQSLMTQGHELFSENQFEEAIEKYETASNKRPINVYPRVKIADVQLAMMNYVEEEPEIPEQKEIKPEVLEVSAKKEPTQEERVKNALKEEEQRISDSLPAAPHFPEIKEKPEVEKEIPVVKKEEINKMTVEEFSSELAVSYPDGVTEEVLMENGKKITRRVVVKNGKGSDYRKVEHRWGGVFYFKNDEAITAHTWNSETVLD